MLFEVVSSVAKFVFTVIIYLFIFGIMRLIYLDIKSMGMRRNHNESMLPYLKLINRREHLDFKMEETYTLAKNLDVGRSDLNHIVIKDNFISGKHAKLWNRDGLCWIEDLNSKNGTFVNENQIKAGEGIPLKDGDKIRMGHVEFLFVKGTSRGEL